MSEQMLTTTLVTGELQVNQKAVADWIWQVSSLLTSWADYGKLASHVARSGQCRELC